MIQVHRSAWRHNRTSWRSATDAVSPLRVPLTSGRARAGGTAPVVAGVPRPEARGALPARGRPGGHQRVSHDRPRFRGDLGGRRVPAARGHRARTGGVDHCDHHHGGTEPCRRRALPVGADARPAARPGRVADLGQRPGHPWARPGRRSAARVRDRRDAAALRVGHRRPDALRLCRHPHGRDGGGIHRRRAPLPGPRGPGARPAALHGGRRGLAAGAAHPGAQPPTAVRPERRNPGAGRAAGRGDGSVRASDPQHAAPADRHAPARR